MNQQDQFRGSPTLTQRGSRSLGRSNLVRSIALDVMDSLPDRCIVQSRD